MNKKTRFSIVIVHFNGYKRLKNLLESVLIFGDSSDEIIVVDNSSEDNSIKKIKEFYKEKKITFIDNSSNKGYGFAANQGINYASGEFLLICNNDIVLTKNSLNKFKKIFDAEPMTGMISGQMTDKKGNISNTVSGEVSFLTQLDGIDKLFRRKINTKKNIYVKNLRGACLAVRMKTVEEVGAYDEDFFFYFEDSEWCYRISKSNWKIVFSPFITFFHEGGGSTSPYFQRSRIEFFRSRLILWKKIFSPIEYFILLVWNFSKQFLDFAVYALLSLLTFFCIEKYKSKALERILIISWFLFGKPKNWGLRK